MQRTSALPGRVGPRPPVGHQHFEPDVALHSVLFDPFARNWESNLQTRPTPLIHQISDRKLVPSLRNLSSIAVAQAMAPGRREQPPISASRVRLSA